MEKLISVIVPVYNIDKYLNKCLDTILSQSYSNIEIILVDDGSSDNSGEICNDYAKKDKRINVIHKANGGLVAAWKTGLINTSPLSEYVAFIDGDDWVSNNYIKSMVDILEKHNPDMVVSLNIPAYGSKTKRATYPIKPGFYDEKDISNTIYPVLLNHGGFESRGIPVSRCGKLIKKGLVSDNAKYVNDQTTYAEDLNIILPAVIDANSIYIMDDSECVYYYRQNAYSMQHKYNPRLSVSIGYVYTALLQICDDKNVPELKHQVYADFIAASVQFYKMELLNPRGVTISNKNVSTFIDESMFKKAISMVNWNNYGTLNICIIRIMRNFNWFNRNISTRLLCILKKYRYKKLELLSHQDNYVY